MAEERTYLELSEEGEGSHKFYELTVDDKTVTIRYGRIGDAGQTSTKSYPSAEKAKADADKKIQEKVRKGYEKAVMGVRKKRAVTRRETPSQPSTSKTAPILWKFSSGNSRAFGIFIDDARCWVGNESGKVYALDHEGKAERQFELPDGVKCIVADDVWIYAGCDDGNVYDLTGRVPQIAYTIAENVDIYWLDIWSGILGVSDAAGKVTIINPEEESLWNRKSNGMAGWMVRLDRRAVYHGHSGGVTAYALSDGSPLWEQKSAYGVMFGWQTVGAVDAGTTQYKVFHLDKETGKELAVQKCDSGVFSCASSEDGKYVFAGDNCSSVYCFDDKGKRLWKLGTGCGSALSMQFWKDRLYIVTTDGSLACLDASEAAIQAAQAGKVPKARQIQAPTTPAAVPTTALESTTDTSQGVIVECVADGSKLRVRPVSPGYHAEWNVQFPRNLRQAGARYVVDQVRESAQGGFYRAYGDIKKLDPNAPSTSGTGGKKKKK
jgi:predicted DNA-binding WGR domain protein